MSDEYTPPLGPRFSQLYLERLAPGKDSARLRVRVAALFEHDFSAYTQDVYKNLERRLGTDLEYVQGAYDISAFLKNCSLRDFYDAITIVRDTIAQNDRHGTGARYAAVWVRHCQAALIEENIAYRVDDEGVVHPFVDVEFNRNVESLIMGLSDPRLAAVRSEAEQSLAALDAAQPDTKQAIRSIFEAIEIYAKLAVTSYQVARLDRNVVKDHLLPLIQAAPGMDSPAKAASNELAESLCLWIKGAHIYRHGQSVNEPAPPPLDLAIAFVSSGVGYLRWLVENTANNLAP